MPRSHWILKSVLKYPLHNPRHIHSNTSGPSVVTFTNIFMVNFDCRTTKFQNLMENNIMGSTTNICAEALWWKKKLGWWYTCLSCVAPAKAHYEAVRWYVNRMKRAGYLQNITCAHHPFNDQILVSPHRAEPFTSGWTSPSANKPTCVNVDILISWFISVVHVNLAWRGDDKPKNMCFRFH